VLDRLCGSVGAWWGFDRFGVFRIMQLALPGGAPVHTLTDIEIIAIDRIPTTDTDQGIPVSKVQVNHTRRETVLSDDQVNPSTAAVFRAALVKQYDVSTADNSSVLTAYPSAGRLERNTQLAGGSYGEETRLAGIYGSRRDRFNAKVRASNAALAAIDLGVVVRVVYPRFGMDSGMLLRVIGIELDLAARMIDLVLWR